MSALLDEAQRVHGIAGLSDRVIAAATGAKPSTVRGWLAGRGRNSDACREAERRPVIDIDVGCASDAAEIVADGVSWLASA